MRAAGSVLGILPAMALAVLSLGSGCEERTAANPDALAGVGARGGSERVAGVPESPTGPRAPEPFAEHAVVVEPTTIDFGVIGVNNTASRILRITNTADGPRQLLGTPKISGCVRWSLDPPIGCRTLQAGETIETTVTWRASSRPGSARSWIRILVDGQPELIVKLRAETIRFVEIEPEYLDPRGLPEGRALVRATDGRPFRILSMDPPIIEEFPADARTEHEILIDWDRWKELGLHRKFRFALDHPECRSLWTAVIPGGVPGERQLADELKPAPIVVAEPAALDFGRIPTGQWRSRTATVVNRGERAVQLTSFTMLRTARVIHDLDLPCLLEPGGEIEIELQLLGDPSPHLRARVIRARFADHPAVPITAGAEPCTIDGTAGGDP